MTSSIATLGTRVAAGGKAAAAAAGSAGKANKYTGQLVGVQRSGDQLFALIAGPAATKGRAGTSVLFDGDVSNEVRTASMYDGRALREGVADTSFELKRALFFARPMRGDTQRQKAVEFSITHPSAKALVDTASPANIPVPHVAIDKPGVRVTVSESDAHKAGSQIADQVRRL